jgi:hypothetical protein
MTNGQPASSPDLVESIIASSDPQVALATQLVDYATAGNPLLADLLQVGAVPRKFDASTLRLLIDSQPSDTDFSNTFSTFVAMPFISRRRDGRYRMHDEIRRAMLSRFTAADGGQEVLKALNTRLADHYDTAHDQARTVADQFDTVDELLREITPERVPDMRSAVENQLVRPLIEAQHHRTAVDPEGAGLAHFHRSFEKYDYEGQFEVCRLLLHSWRNDIEDLPEVPDTLRDWEMYYQVRLATAEGDGHTAREIADQLLARPGLETRIRLQTQGLVTRGLITECRFADALRENAKEIELRGNDDPDPGNRWIVFAQQAGIHRMLFDGIAEVASLRAALEATRSAHTRDSEAHILQQLSAVEAKQGNLVDASRHAVQALHIVRTLREPDVIIAAQGCAVQLMLSFGAADPRLADVFHAEAALLSRGSNIQRFVATELAYVTALTGSDQFARAHRVLDQVDARLGDQHPVERADVMISRANLLGAEGREREAVGVNRRTFREAERQRGSIWALAAALTNAATTQMHIGDLLDEACSSADRARGLWLEMDNRRGTARTDVVRAEVNRRRGKYEEAQEALGAGPPLEAMGLEEIWYWSAAHLSADLDRLDEAADHMNAFIDVSVRSGAIRDAARASAELVEILLHAGHQEKAAAATARLGDFMNTLNERRQYQRSPESEQADEHNGRAVRQLSVMSARPFDAARDAVQHLSEAQQADSGPCWYALNQAYAYLRLGDRKSAAKAIDVAAAKAAGTDFAEPIANLAAELTPSAEQ